MSYSLRRFVSAGLAAAVVLSLGAEPLFAQVTPGASVGPAGGVGSTTAPSNGQGTPAGGTGTLSTTRVGPSAIAPAPMGSVGTAPVASQPTVRATRHRSRRARRAARRHAAEIGTQSQAGTNGAAPAATR